jgi:hypothetical protein
MRWRFFLRLALCIGSITPAGCSSTRVACDCVTSDLQISSGVPVAQIVTTGAACPTYPFCLHPLGGGQCDQFDVPLTAAGTCHIDATAADGRQTTLDETVSLAAVSSCCGKIYRGSDAQVFIFPPIDAGTQSVDAAAERADAAGPDVVDARPPTSVPLPPDPTGWVDRTATGTTNIQGRWYGFADGFGADGTTASGACEMTGQHAPADCSYLTTPSVGSFPNANGKMCTTGVAARVVNIVGGTIPDYNNITGAGIAFSFNLAGMTATPLPYNATANGVTGISFDIDTIPLTGLRIQFPTTEQSMYPPFWGGFNMTSPVVAGHNELHWKEVLGPFYDATAPPFDPTAVIRVEFFVQSSVAAAAQFSFCVSNLAALL